jgi:tetratricopeptide (TPR) repeat protein
MLAVLLAAVVSASTSHMGVLTFPVTGNAQCQKHFTEGMLALHSFMYERARGDFQEAAKADAKCAMARWGEAMTYNHPLWGSEDLTAARAALDAVKDAQGLTDKERAFLGAARALFGEGDLKARLKAWLGAAADMHQRFPGDDEVALEHALALIANSERLSDQRKLMQAAAIGLDVFARRPQHPGAAHYVIHACDTPDHAILALSAANQYAQIAPSASHALHMPSHIFVQLGMWERVARSNEAAWAASQKDAQGKKIDDYDWHTYAWLGAAYAELGQEKRARKLLDDLAARLAREDGAEPRFGYSLAAHLYLTDSEAWAQLDEVLQPIASHLPLEKGDPPDSVGCAQHAPGGGLGTRLPVGLLSQVSVHRVRAEVAMRRGDEAGVKAELAALAPVYQALAPWKPMFSASAHERREAIEGFLLTGAHAYHEQTPAAYDAAVAAANRLIDAGDPLANGPAFDPPGEEWLGELQMAAGRPKEALAAFDAALVKHPRLSRALLGAARAAKAAGDEAVARARYTELAGLWADADADLPALAEVRAAAKGGP